MQNTNCRLTDSLSLLSQHEWHVLLLHNIGGKFDIFWMGFNIRTMYNTSVHSLGGKLLIGAMTLSGERSRFSFDAS